jgi:hypothetical protein
MRTCVEIFDINKKLSPCFSEYVVTGISGKQEFSSTLVEDFATGERER